MKLKALFSRSIIAFTLILASMLLTSNQSKAQLALYDGFDYTVGSNIGGDSTATGQAAVNNWKTHSVSAASAGTVNVQSGTLSYPGLLASTGNKVRLPGSNSTTSRDVNRALPTDSVYQYARTLYYSALINVVDTTQLKTTFDHFLHFGTSAGNSAGTLPGRIGIKNDLANSGFRLGVQNLTRTGGASAFTDFGQTFQFGSTYLVVMKFDTLTNVATLWVNPSSLGGAEPNSGFVINDSGTRSATKFTYRSICLRNSSSTAKVDIDEIRVGTTWASVTPAGSNVPTLSVTASPASFGGICVGTTSSYNAFTFSGANLTTDNIKVGPFAGYQFSTDSTTGYADSLSLSHAAGSYGDTIYVKFSPIAAISYNGTAQVSGGGANAASVSLSGSGLPNNPSVTTNPATVNSSTWAVVVSANIIAGCSEVTEYGFLYGPDSLSEYANQTHYALNTLSGSVFTDTSNDLGPNETHYYVAYIITAGDTVYGAQQQFTTGATVLQASVNSLNFGTLCTSADSIRSFRLSGHYLTTDPIVIDYLDGYSFAVDSVDGSYSSGNSLYPSNNSTNIDTTIFVKFSPTSAAAYNDSMVIYIGTDTVKVGLSGTGVSTPLLLSSPASAVTNVDAVLHGNITRSCENTIVEYGFIYGTDTTLHYSLDSTSGITVVASNLSGTNEGTFTQSVDALNPNTTYYYVAYAITANSDTVMGEPHATFTTFGPSLSASTLTSFGVNCLNAVAGPNSFVVTGTYLNASDVVVGPLAGYTFSSSAAGSFDDSLVITQSGGSFTDTVYVKFTPTAVQSYNGTISIIGGGAPTYSVNAVGSGAAAASVATGSASAVTESSATLTATTTDGCQAISAQGFVYSSINLSLSLTSGDQTISGTVSGSSFSSALSSLQDTTTYYYVAYIISAGDTTYGNLDSVTTLSAAPINVLVVTTVGSTDIYSDEATLNGSVSCTGSCGITSYGFVYSGSQGFNPQTASNRVKTTIAANNNFSCSVTGLVQNTAYYYRAFVIAAGDTVYAEEEKMFTTAAVKPGFNVYPTPARTGSPLKFSISNIKPGPYQVRLINAAGQLVAQQQKTVSGTNTVMQDQITVPFNLAPGMYFIQVASPDYRVQKEIIIL